MSEKTTRRAPLMGRMRITLSFDVDEDLVAYAGRPETREELEACLTRALEDGLAEMTDHGARRRLEERRRLIAAEMREIDILLDRRPEPADPPAIGILPAGDNGQKGEDERTAVPAGGVA